MVYRGLGFLGSLTRVRALAWVSKAYACSLVVGGMRFGLHTSIAKNKKNSTVTRVFYLLLVVGACGVTAQGSAQGTPGVVVRQQHLFTVDMMADLVEREDEIRAGLLYDAERGVVVWAKNMYTAYPIASLTKMMVALLAVEDVRAGKVHWHDKVTVVRVSRKSRRSRRISRSTATYTLEALMQLAMIPSNNRACMDIAIYLAGSPEAFVDRMNAKAQALGMQGTFYTNPSGLPGSAKTLDNRSSPHDLLLLALELIKCEEILKITSMGFAEIGHGKHTAVFRNHNSLVIEYETAVDGLKTGYTRRAKYCLVATAKKADRRVISVVLGVDSPTQRNEIVASMLNNYYEHIGSGPMLPTRGGGVVRKRRVSVPTVAATLVRGGDNVIGRVPGRCGSLPWLCPVSSSSCVVCGSNTDKKTLGQAA